jgi:predicted RNase H-like nuclease (RuvC/YqgF family)
MSDCSKDETSSTTAQKHNRRNRNTKVQKIAIKSTEKDETIKRLEVENGILKKRLEEAQQTIYTLASGHHL